MAVREFTDSEGVEWRVWAVTPMHLHPVTRGEDYMMGLQDGWLVFESRTGKRRLEAPYPAAWTEYGIAKLEELCRRASPVVWRHAHGGAGDRQASAPDEIESVVVNDFKARRTFLSPRGREWTVRVHECLDRFGAEQKVLRFTSGDVVVELSQWSDDWRNASVEQFAMMLLDANPPRRREVGDGPQRRREDRLI
ncbi:MAG: hypothetical protein ACHQRK_02600 [Gemmatimonadales bacterium]|jgi:hypothetical protein